jgi:hypothetical protein
LGIGNFFQNPYLSGFFHLQGMSDEAVVRYRELLITQQMKESWKICRRKLMAYDQGLAQRISEVLDELTGTVEK